MMNLCGWLKTFKRKGKNAIGTSGADEDVDEVAPPGDSEIGERSTSGKRANSGHSGGGGWGRKIKSVTKLATGERTNGQRAGTPKAKEAHSSETDTGVDAVESSDEGR
uniref:Uncharacterized protein n=1 Tax=Anopheles culicifacies TaxID=139723 RepID=A0A182MFQ6_9DIPT